MHPRTLLLALAAPLLLGCQGGSAPAPGYVESIEAYRADREQRLRADGGWLTVVGLHWLEPGENTYGTGPANAIVLPPGSAPEVAGRLRYDGSSVRLAAAPGVETFVGGEPVRERELAFGESTDEVRLGRLTFFVIERGGRHAVRVKDPESPARRGFRGLDFYPVDATWHSEGRLVRHEEPRATLVETIVGIPAEMLTLGRVEFLRDGTTMSLEALVSSADDDEVFLMFRDDTSGSETYGAGRYLYATLEGDRVDLDFNRAYNPPCAFTAHATCPLPPPGNRLPVPVRAGERAYDSH